MATKTFDFDIKIKLDYDLGDAVIQIEKLVREAIKNSMSMLKQYFYEFVIFPMVNGGAGWYSIKDTQFWKWVNSKRGYAVLGLTSTKDPYKLIAAYNTSWEFNLTEDGMGFTMGFGDVEKLRTATRHPAAGKKHLPADRSWFDWMYQGTHFRKSEPAKFIKENSKNKGVRSRFIAGEESGLMVKYKKEGAEWHVPPRFLLDMDYFLERNRGKIQRTIENFITLTVDEYLRG